MTFQATNNMTFHLYSNLLKNMFFSPPPQLNDKEIYVQGGEQVENGRLRQPGLEP